MSGLIVGLVLRLPITDDFNSEAKFVATVYADHAWEDGTHAYPAVSTVAGITGYSERTIQRYLRALETLGLLIPDGHGPRGTNRYRFPLVSGQDGSVRLALVRGDIVTPQKAEKPADSGDSLTPRQPDGGDTESGDTESGDTIVSPKQTTLKSLVVVNDEFGGICKRYEDEFGPLTPLIADAIRDDIETYTEGWVLEAMDIAVRANARRWSYVDGILKNCKAAGKRPALNAKEQNNGNAGTNKRRATKNSPARRAQGSPGDQSVVSRTDGHVQTPADDPEAAQRHRDQWARLREQAKVPTV